MKRILTAVVALPILIATILISSLWWVFVLLAAAAMVVGLWEFFLLAKKLKLQPEVAAGYVAAAALITIPLQNDPANVLLVLFVLIAVTIATLIVITFRGAPFDKMISSVGSTLLGVLYIPLLGSHLIALRTGFTHQLSADLLSFFFLVLMGSDVGAYYTGRALGKRKLAPSISPGKTWEGAVGGVAAALAMAALAHFWFFRQLPLKYALPLAAVMAVLGIFGDLAESALKRGAGAKDAANILPGHGGILDRLDSLLFNAPLIYYFARFYFHS